MQTFTEREWKLIEKLKIQPSPTVLKIVEPCPLHSVCTPLPLFRVYKVDDEKFEAEWNSHHERGVKQVFRFNDLQPPR